MMNTISRDLGFQYELYIVPDGQFGALKEGEWTGIVGQVISGVSMALIWSDSLVSESEIVYSETLNTLFYSRFT